MMAGRKRASYWLIGLGAPLSCWLLIEALPRLSHQAQAYLVTREFCLAAFTALLLFIVVRSGALSTRAIGLKSLGMFDLASAAAAAALALFLSVIAINLMAGFGFKVGGASVYDALSGQSASTLLIVAFVAGFSEEATCRSILMAAIEKAGCSKLPSIVISAVVFSLPHVPTYGTEKAAISLIPGLVFGSLFAWRRNLPCCIVAHALLDGLGLLALSFRHHL